MLNIEWRQVATLAGEEFRDPPGDVQRDGRLEDQQDSGHSTEDGTRARQ